MPVNPYDNEYDNAGGFSEVQYELAVSNNPDHEALYDDSTIPVPPQRNSIHYASLKRNKKTDESEYIETLGNEEKIFERSVQPPNEYHYIEPTMEFQNLNTVSSVDYPEPTHKNTMERVERQSTSKKDAAKWILVILSFFLALGAVVLVETIQLSPSSETPVKASPRPSFDTSNSTFIRTQH